MDKNMQQTYPAEMPMENPVQQQSMPCPYMNTCPYINTCPYMQQSMMQNMGQSMMQPGQSGNEYQGGYEMRSQYYGNYYPYPPY